ncbi:MAG TPA: SDR family NAD(P)-dependent oxidoreductase, partial [Dehalococcoidia bacterium]|nr:SDR family NAD(P)-dependent oxidoreductase [Dehalococcoidia bacterium]
MRLAGKVALITGSGGGQGKAAALLFAREGAKVVVNDLREEPVKQVVDTIQAAGGEAIGVAADVSRKGPVDGLIDRAIATYGRLDILYNNAG